MAGDPLTAKKKPDKPPKDLPTRTTGIIDGWFYEDGKPIKTVLAIGKYAHEVSRTAGERRDP